MVHDLTHEETRDVYDVLSGLSSCIDTEILRANTQLSDDQFDALDLILKSKFPLYEIKGPQSFEEAMPDHVADSTDVVRGDTESFPRDVPDEYIRELLDHEEQGSPRDSTQGASDP